MSDDRIIDKLICRECRRALPDHDALCSRWKGFK